MKSPSSPSLCRGHVRAFTLIELLVVIAIIGVLAAFIFPVLHSVARTTNIARAKAEMTVIETALDNYKAHYGSYPPSNGTNPAAALYNQLYYELSGVTNVTLNSIPSYQKLDGGSIIGVAFYANMFNVGGPLNCSTSAGEDAVPARSFLQVKANQVGALPITNRFGGYTVNFLATSLGGPDATYQPMGLSGLNPFRYLAPGPTNHNVNGYDLWIQLVMGGKTNLLCNWHKGVVINSPLP